MKINIVIPTFLFTVGAAMANPVNIPLNFKNATYKLTQGGGDCEPAIQPIMEYNSDGTPALSLSGLKRWPLRKPKSHEHSSICNESSSWSLEGNAITTTLVFQVDMECRGLGNQGSHRDTVVLKGDTIDLDVQVVDKNKRGQWVVLDLKSGQGYHCEWTATHP